jgi:hypothetical protein
LKIRLLPIVLLACAAPLALAQGSASPAKKELVAKLLQLQQPEFDQAARGLVQQPALQMMQQAGPVLQTQVPADKREAVGKAIEADVRKYVDETYPLVRERALKLAPTTVGVVLEEKFSEDELKQLIAWYDSPVNKKFQQLGNEMRGSFLQKLVPEARPLMQPKLQALEQQVRTSLGLPAPEAGAAPAAAPKGDAKAAAKPPARAASR